MVSDIEMPKMNGFALAKAVRSHARFSHLPMLAVSSRADKLYTDRGLEAGFNVYLEKVQAPVLLETVLQLGTSRGAA